MTWESEDYILEVIPVKERWAVVLNGKVIKSYVHMNRAIKEAQAKAFVKGMKRTDV